MAFATPGTLGLRPLVSFLHPHIFAVVLTPVLRAAASAAAALKA